MQKIILLTCSFLYISCVHGKKFREYTYSEYVGYKVQAIGKIKYTENFVYYSAIYKNENEVPVRLIINCSLYRSGYKKLEKIYTLPEKIIIIEHGDYYNTELAIFPYQPYLRMKCDVAIFGRGLKRKIVKEILDQLQKRYKKNKN